MRLFDRRLLREARRARLGLALTVGLGATGGVLAVLQARALSQAVTRVFLGGSSLTGIAPLLGVLLILAVARAAAIWGSEAAAGDVAARVKISLRERLFGRLLDLGPAYARGERTGELVNTAVEGIEALDAYFSQYLPQLALAALVPLTILAFVFPLDPLSGLVFLLTAPLIPIFMILIGDQADAMTRRQWTTLSRMSAHFLDVLQGLPTLKLFNRSRDQLRTIAAISDRHRQATMGVLRVAFLSALVLEMVATLSTAVVAVEIGVRLLYGRLAFEQAFFILILAPEFYLPLRLLGARFHAGVAGVTAAERIYEIADCGLPTPALVPERPGSREPEQAPGSQDSAGASVVDCGSLVHSRQSAISHQPSAISFRHVSFSYPGERRAALEDVSFDLLPGQTVALVGTSGGGKSTIAQLLLRFAEPSTGEITVDSEPLRDFPADAWRRRLAWVPQLPYLFNASVADNIRLGCPDASPDQVAHAARLAGAHDFIQALPDGYEMVIGERGARLSGGQAQRIALARAFLVDAPLVVLDEPTAHLDPETEAEIEESLARLQTGRAALVIAHRLHTVRRADLILVLDGGRIVEAGTHETLSRIPGGAYARLLAAPAGPETESGCSASHPDADPAIPGAPDQTAPNTPPHTSRSSAEPPVWTPPASRLSAEPPVRSFHVLRFLLSFLAPFGPRILLSILLGFAAIACGIGLMGASAWIIASAALGPSIAELQVAIVGVRFFGIARGFARYGERLASHDVTFRVLARLRVWFYAAIEPLAPARLGAQRSGDLLSRAVGDIGALENFYLRAVSPAAVAVLTALLAATLAGQAAPQLAVLLLLFLTLGGAAAPLLAHVLGRQPGRRLAAARGELNAALVDGIQGIADLTAFDGARAQLDRVRALSRDLSGLQRRMAAIGGLNSALVSLCGALAALAMLAGATPLVAGGALSGVTLAGLVMIALASFEAVTPLPVAAQHLESSLEAGRRLLSLAAATTRSNDFSSPAGPALLHPATEVAPAAAATARSGDFSRSTPGSPPRTTTAEAAPVLSIERLRFRYAEHEPWALDGVRFDLLPGEHLTIVGPSGSGKTTLVNLLLRFWDPQHGSIRMAGNDLRGMDPDEVRRNFGVVTQNTHLFGGTIRDNLLLARPDAGAADLDAAIGRAQLADFVRSLPDGYDTWVGELGLQLSGGERQRLAIARALLKDAPILLLDEPVANLDSVTGRAVLDAVRELMAGRSVLSITHSLAGIEDAAPVLLLHAGRVVERGRHADLLAQGGIYRRMWSLELGVLEE
jgi:ATP-binding cassette subfamily C protein CydCD